MGAYQKAMQRFGHTKAFRAIFKHTLPRIDRTFAKLSGGRIVFGSSVVPTFILVHTGRKTGRQLKTPLSFVQVGASYALAASNWGQAKHPAWSGNLLANPKAQVIVKGKTIPVTARQVSANEKAELWPRFTAMWPAYDTYVERSGRDIRVFLLEPN